MLRGAAQSHGICSTLYIYRTGVGKGLTFDPIYSCSLILSFMLRPPADRGPQVLLAALLQKARGPAIIKVELLSLEGGSESPKPSQA